MLRIPQEEENMIGTDSAIRDENAQFLPHPRGMGTFPRFIRVFVNEKKLLPIDEVMYRMSGLPAKVFKLNKRGLIKENYFADIVLFNSETISDRSTFQKPFNKPDGIYYVLINGKIVLGDSGDSSSIKSTLGIINEISRYLNDNLFAVRLYCYRILFDQKFGEVYRCRQNGTPFDEYPGVFIKRNNNI